MNKLKACRVLFLMIASAYGGTANACDAFLANATDDDLDIVVYWPDLEKGPISGNIYLESGRPQKILLDQSDCDHPIIVKVLREETQAAQAFLVKPTKGSAPPYYIISPASLLAAKAAGKEQVLP